MFRSVLIASTVFVAGICASQASANETLVPPKPVGQPQIQLAQASDTSFRVNELEDRIRQLNGKVEELTFQLLQMQEEMRKMQEDNELRFQELEDKQSDASDAVDPQSNSSQLAKTDTGEGDNSLGKSEPSGNNSPDVKPANQATQLGAKPRALGTLTFDKDGNVVDRNRTSDADGGRIAALPLPGVFSDGVAGGAEAAEFGPTPSAVFSTGLTAIERRNYERGESAFRAFLRAWPNDPRTGEARYHLGQALFWKGDYFNAANVYLDTHNAHPNAPTAPDNLLGLGLSLAGLNQREVACATYSEVLKQYPSAAGRLGAQLAAEQASAKC